MFCVKKAERGGTALLLKVPEAENGAQKSHGEKVKRRKSVAAREESWRLGCPGDLRLHTHHAKI